MEFYIKIKTIFKYFKYLLLLIFLFILNKHVIFAVEQVDVENKYKIKNKMENSSERSSFLLKEDLLKEDLLKEDLLKEEKFNELKQYYELLKILYITFSTIDSEKLFKKQAVDKYEENTKRIITNINEQKKEIKDKIEKHIEKYDEIIRQIDKEIEILKIDQKTKKIKQTIEKIKKTIENKLEERQKINNEIMVLNNQKLKITNQQNCINRHQHIIKKYEKRLKKQLQYSEQIRSIIIKEKIEIEKEINNLKIIKNKKNQSLLKDETKITELFQNINIYDLLTNLYNDFFQENFIINNHKEIIKRETKLLSAIRNQIEKKSNSNLIKNILKKQKNQIEKPLQNRLNELKDKI
ncbi:hypothetical protein AXA84_0116 [Candidatus Phytoplasma oryzae]|uniref:Uncharacterized protein n=1 Tax=Candidatus Phytoplasma oryzae TaxID=203274 RepID=A0A139JRJ8_9MOLU|nr:hypothetical protein [Candidatus Phytoplasma oryzae]KXT29470.1 hypothetical protein AXA84_0116 [Candidatus Phytoplasma oryzae]